MMITLAQEATGNEVYLYWGFILVAAAVVLLFTELLVPSGGLIGMLAQGIRHNCQGLPMEPGV